jgi:hypothetical protein
MKILAQFDTGCGITGGVEATCEDLRKVGGVNKKIWLGNLSDFANPSHILSSDGYINYFAFNTYGGLYAFAGKKLSNSAGVEFVNGEGANLFNHTITLKVFTETPEAYGRLEDLSGGEVVAIVEDNSNNFKVYGLKNGLEMTGLTQNSGTEFTADTSFNITLSGAETELPKFFFRTSYAITKAQLEAYEL